MEEYKAEIEIAEKVRQLESEMTELKKLVTENNTLLRKMSRQMVWGFWLRIVWYALLVGLPFAVYFYVLEPYFAALGSNYETFSAGIQEIPGWKHLNEFINSGAD